MLIQLDKFGGRMPQAIDPALIPAGKSQEAINCRFDQGGVAALKNDVPIVAQSKTGLLLTIYRYSDGNFFQWLTDVDVCAAPNPADAYGRIYFTENGELKVTDKFIYKQGGTEYPMVSYNPCPPAPVNAPTVAAESILTAVTGLTIADLNCVEANGTYNLIFSGGGGSGATGTYTILNNIITNVSLTAGGSYASNPTVTTQSGDGVITATGVQDATLVETRGYVYTFVNGYGAEGPPSPVSSLIDIYDGNTAAITGMDGNPDTTTQKYNITKKRIYRLNQSSTSAIYQFVAEVDVDEASYDDSILDSALSEVLATAEWEAPPVGIQGIKALPNGGLVGFVGNLLCFSVPGYPHAWPTSYQKPTDYPIVGLGVFGTTVGVLTSGIPYLAVGSDPSNVVMETMDLGYSCMSKRGIIQAGDIIVYPCPEGLAAIGPGVREIITEGVMTRQDWQRLYNPETINAYFWEGKYIGFYESNGIKAGFMFDIKSKDLTDLTFYAAAGYRDKGTGTLYLSLGE
ncbi:MAG: hypothetical protein PHV90_00335 [Smithella sp.]|nr:hypothetical protein [Smithella sp.]